MSIYIFIMTNGIGSIKGVPRAYDKNVFEVINVMSKNKMSKIDI